MPSCNIVTLWTTVKREPDANLDKTTAKREPDVNLDKVPVNPP